MDFSSMSGWDFERYCADCLLKKGFTKAEVTSGSGDHGVDIIAEQNGIRFGIQCKLYQGQIPNKAVQEAYTGASYYDCDVAVIMSNSEMTKQAQVEAEKLRVKFWSIMDYVSGEDKQSSKMGSPYKESSKPTNYEEYVQKQKECEYALKQKIEKELEASSQSDELLPELKVLQQHEFKAAWRWLEPKNFQNETWYPFIQSIKSYHDELETMNAHVAAENLLLAKLSYIWWLKTSLNMTGKGLQSILWENGRDVTRFLQTNATGATSVNAKELNIHYWTACYLFEQEQTVFELIKDVIKDFDPQERSRIRTITTQKEFNAIEQEIYKYKGVLGDLEEWWRWMPEQEEYSRQDFVFWKNDEKIENQIRKNKAVVKEVYERDVNFQEYQLKQQRERERQEEILKRKKRTITKLIEQYHLDLKQLDVKKEKVLSNKRDINQEKIQQAQFQIDECLRQKNSFALFRKKRDAELDEKISVLTRHISQLKESLQRELEEYEQAVQTERAKLLEEVLFKANKEGVREEVKVEL